LHVNESESGLPPIFKWFAESSIAASGRPASPEEIKGVADQGIRRVVATTTADFELDTYKDLGMSCEFVPNAGRDLDVLDRAVEAVNDAVTAGEPLLVH
jgi:hypothetical protein